MQDFWTNLVQILISALAAGLCAFLVYLWNELKNSDFFSNIADWIESKTGIANTEMVDNVIAQLTAAADQLVKAGELVKEDRLKYVTARLNDLSIEMTDLVRAKIEAAVAKLPKLEIEDK